MTFSPYDYPGEYVYWTRRDVSIAYSFNGCTTPTHTQGDLQSWFGRENTSIGIKFKIN